MEEQNVEYEEEFDTLYLYNSNEPTKVAGSIILNNVLVDLSSSGDVVGIQIEDASEHLGIPGKVLKEIKTAKIVTLARGNALMILYTLNSLGYHSTNNLLLSKNQLSQPIYN
jgi:uncharacterized protein YuzE